MTRRVLTAFTLCTFLGCSVSSTTPKAGDDTKTADDAQGDLATPMDGATDGSDPDDGKSVVDSGAEDTVGSDVVPNDANTGDTALVDVEEADTAEPDMSLDQSVEDASAQDMSPGDLGEPEISPVDSAPGDAGEADVAEDAAVVDAAPPDVMPPGDVGGDGAEGLCDGLDPAMSSPAAIAGCSDGTREGFIDVMKHPLIAACGGAWTLPGVHETVPACNYEAGNTGLNTAGSGCNVADLCAPNWHVCLGKDDVDVHNPTGCDGIMDCAQSPAFFLARTSSNGAFNCTPDAIGAPESLNDLFGCGDLGCPATKATCAPLTLGSHNLCKSIKNMPGCDCYFAGELPPADPKYADGDMETVVCKPNPGGCGWCKPVNYWNKKLDVSLQDAWDCGKSSTTEASNVVKTDPYSQGGVLCCKTF